MSQTEPRLSQRTFQVLNVLLDRPKDGLAGSEIARQTGMLSGTLYPILVRLEKAGELRSKWEELDPKEAGRPRKRFYHLTPIGQNKANKALTDLGVPDKGARMELILSIVVGLLIYEIYAWLPKLSETFLNWGVRQLPSDEQDRYREEWTIQTLTTRRIHWQSSFMR